MYLRYVCMHDVQASGPAPRSSRWRALVVETGDIPRWGGRPIAPLRGKFTVSGSCRGRRSSNPDGSMVVNRSLSFSCACLVVDVVKKSHV